MDFTRAAARWIGRAGRLGIAVGGIFELLDQVEEINLLTDMIRTANDPPRTIDELQNGIGSDTQAGYHKHHIAEEAAARDAGFPENMIQGRDNLVRVPILKHIEVTRYYARKELQPDGRRLSPREMLKDKDFETRRQFGLDVLRRFGVLR
jgi:hypothetical protein